MRKRRRMGLYWLAVALALATTSPWSLVSGPLRANIQNLLFDQFQRWRPRVDPPGTPVRIVEVDDEFDPAARAMAVAARHHGGLD